MQLLIKLRQCDYPSGEYDEEGIPFDYTIINAEDRNFVYFVGPANLLRNFRYYFHS